MTRISTSAAATLCLMLAAPGASAHFAWLCLSDDAHARLFFGEGLDDREYHLPERVAAAAVAQTDIDAPDKQLAMAEYEEEGFFGLEADDGVEPRGRLRSEIVYGAYHGSKLTYYAQHYAAENPHAWPAEPDDTLALQALLRVEGDTLRAQVLWRGEPLTGATVTLTHEGADKDDEGVSAPVDGEGVASFPTAELAEGLNGLLVMHNDDADRGEFEGEPYESATHILTVTFTHAPDAARVGALPPLPEAVASFGAAASDGWLYVYGGHIGQAHDHSRENLSRHFRRIRLDGSGGWQELAAGPPLQGLALVAHGGRLYRVGGLDARNASGEDEDLHSVDGFAAYDPATDAWTDLPPLPEPRSSHNAVVVGDTLYVVGGWTLEGDSDGRWLPGALAYDLAAPDAEWVALAEPPFRRRALAVGHAGGRVAVLCGMTDDAKLSPKVFFYNPADGSWSEGPDFPGEPFHGFGLAAWNLDGRLYAGGMAGDLQRLSDDRLEWIAAGEFQTARFFHQLAPDGRGGLLAVAGASPESGHVASIERVALTETAAGDADDE